MLGPEGPHVTVEGFDGQVSQDDALALAHKQEKRIEGA